MATHLAETGAGSEHFPSQDTATERRSPCLTIIGIGASAGGLAALRSFFSALPAAHGLTFVVVVHLLPTHDSLLADLLQPYTTMPVTQVTARVTMQPDQVYVIPPAKQLLVTDGTLDLTDLPAARRPHLQIDTFFRSLAEAHGDGGALILSGSGSDGALGIQTIKEKGGLVFVQTPAEAEYDGMPRSAIATGVVDLVAPVAELATQLVAAKQTQALVQIALPDETLSTDEEHALRQLLAHLRVRTGHDFSGYKRATLLRRLDRRLQLTHLPTLTAYLQRVRQDGEEVAALYRDLLIHVTAFFRDAAAWTRLRETLVPQLFAGKGRDDTVRVWSVGCATGEEAYSLAMLLVEYADTLATPPAIQVFASDLGQEALALARTGVYPAAIAADVDEQRLARFFIQENHHYRVQPELRQTILFAPHNLLQDPPFAKLDLIVCRNLLIYLQREQQAQVFTTFAYALRPAGYLFLGTAEGATDLFDSLDKQHRFYQCRPSSRAQPRLPALRPVRTSHALALGKVDVASPDSAEEEHRRVREAAGIPSVLVARDYTVLHLAAAAGRYLLTPDGVPTLDIGQLVRPELQPELRAALFRAFETGKATATRPISVQFNGAPHVVYLLVRPHQGMGGAVRALIIFLEDEMPLPFVPVGTSPQTLTEAPPRPVETALQQAHERLLVMREKYETTSEELRAANEELQSINEEYKSTLEELETSQEELQSMNEELLTLNRELKSQVEKLTQAHDDLENLFAGTDIATLFLDPDLRIKRYTPRAVEIFNLMPTDKDRPLAHLRTNFVYEQLSGDAQGVLVTRVPVRREVPDQAGNWFLVEIRPYRTLGNQIDGVVITCVDITTLRAAQAAVTRASEYAEKIVDTIREPLLVLTPELVVQSANAAFYHHFQGTPAQTEGRKLYELGQGEWQIPALRTLLEEVLPENSQFNDFEVSHDFAALGRRTLLLNARRVDHIQLILLAFEDITERKAAEVALQQFNVRLEARVTARTAQVRALAATLTRAEQAERRRIAQLLHDDLQQHLYGIQMRLTSLRTAADPAATVTYAQEAYTWINDAIRLTRQLTVDLSPPILQEEGLTDALGWLATQMAARHGLQVTVRAAHAWRLPDEDLRVLLFQLVRELLFNVVKHAGTDQATVELQEGEDGSLRLTISDQGRGFDVATAAAHHTGGFGLFSVRERLELFGGQMDITSTPGQGTRITLTLLGTRTAQTAAEPTARLEKE